MELSYETDLIGNETRRTLAYPDGGGKSKGGQSEICSLTGREGGLGDWKIAVPPSLPRGIPEKKLFPWQSESSRLSAWASPPQPANSLGPFVFLPRRAHEQREPLRGSSDGS